MAYDSKPNTGALFKNDDKQTDSHPDYKGSLNVDGGEFFLDAWLNVAQSGRKYMSVKVKRKDKQAAAPAPAPRQAPARQAPAADDDIPF